MKTISAFRLLPLLCGLAGSAQAAFIISPVGLSNPAQTITFSEIILENGAVLTNQYASLGVTFSNVYYNTQPLTIGGVNMPLAQNFGIDGDSINLFSIHFLQDQTSVAFNFITNPWDITVFEAWLDGVLQDSGSAPTTIDDTNFYGFTGVTFDEIRISVLPYDSAGGPAALDNIQFGTPAVAGVPDGGSSIVMLGSALSGMAWAHRKTRRRQPPPVSFNRAPAIRSAHR